MPEPFGCAVIDVYGRFSKDQGSLESEDAKFSALPFSPLRFVFRIFLIFFFFITNTFFFVGSDVPEAQFYAFAFFFPISILDALAPQG